MYGRKSKGVIQLLVLIEVARMHETPLTPQSIYHNSQLRQALRLLKADKKNEDSGEEETLHKHVGQFDEVSYVEQTAFHVVKASDSSILKSLFTLSHKMGPVIWRLTENDLEKQTLIAEGYYIRTLLAVDVADRHTGLVRPVLQWMHPSTIPTVCTWRGSYEDTLASRSGVTYIAGWCGEQEVQFVCIKVPLTEKEMFGWVRCAENSKFTEPPAFPTECVACRKELRKAQLCVRCRFANYCSKDCQTSDWKRHKRTCANIAKVMRGTLQKVYEIA